MVPAAGLEPARPSPASSRRPYAPDRR